MSRCRGVRAVSCSRTDIVLTPSTCLPGLSAPLYVLNGIFPPTGPVPSDEDVIGAISAIVWTLTLLPLIKYSIVALSFGTHEGEGGTMALWTVYVLYLAPSLLLGPTFPTDPSCSALYPVDCSLVGRRRRRTVSSLGTRPRMARPTCWTASWRPIGGDTTSFAHQSGRSCVGSVLWSHLLACLALAQQPPLSCPCQALFGTALVLADGILTPAVSVVSAVGGIAVARPSVLESVVPLSIAFLLALFLVQSFGTKKISYAFAPVTIVWFLLIFACGVVNVVAEPRIFRALDPSRAIMCESCVSRSRCALQAR